MRTLLATIAALTAISLHGPALAGGGFCHAPERLDLRATARRADITIASGCIEPTVLRVEPGTTVTWVSEDPYPHTITSGAGEWAEYELIGEDRFSQRFDAEGIYPWYCRYHLNMGGAVVVGAPQPDGVVGDAAPPPDGVTDVPLEGREQDASPASGDSSIPLVALPALAAAGVGFAVGRRRNGN